MSSVVIADDHPMVRDALARVVGQLDAQVRVLEAGDFDALCAHLDGDAPDLLLVDLNMPGMDGLDGLRRLRNAHPALVIVVASGQDDPATIRAALAIGATASSRRSTRPTCCCRPCASVLAGGVYMPPRTLGDCARTACRRRGRTTRA